MLSLFLALSVLYINSAQAFGGSTSVVRMSRSRFDFTGPQTRSDFDTLRDLIVNGGLSVTMKNELRSVLRKHYAKELKAYIQKRRTSKKSKRSSDRASRTLNIKYRNEEGFAYHLMPDLKHAVMSAVFPVPVDTLYSTLFGEDSSFYMGWMQSEQAFNISAQPWNTEEEQEVRFLDYKVKFEGDNMFLPEGFISMTTKQVRFGSSQDGVRYVVDNHNYMEGVPFAESFHSVARHSFRSLSQNTCELRVSVDLSFETDPYPLFRYMIEDNIFPEYEADYTKLEELLSSTLGA